MAMYLLQASSKKEGHIALHMSLLMSEGQKSRSGMEFDDCLAELEEIRTKYVVFLDIIITGYINVSLHRDKGLKRDQRFQRFVQRYGYNTAENYPESPTFVHHIGSTSQIDYILSRESRRITNVEIARGTTKNVNALCCICKNTCQQLNHEQHQRCRTC